MTDMELSLTVMRCWQCGNRLTSPFGHPVQGVERTLPLGEKVRMHKVCARTFDADMEANRITAQPPHDES